MDVLWNDTKKRINLSSDLKTFILILFLRHYLKWKIFHFLSFFGCFVIFVSTAKKQARLRRRPGRENKSKLFHFNSAQLGDREMKKTSRFYRDLATAIAPQSLFFRRGLREN